MKQHTDKLARALRGNLNATESLIALKDSHAELLAALRLYVAAGYGNSTDIALQHDAYVAAQRAIANAVQS